MADTVPLRPKGVSKIQPDRADRGEHPADKALIMEKSSDLYTISPAGRCVSMNYPPLNR